MIWLTWRQFRPQAVAAAVALVVIAILLAASEHSLASTYTSSGLARCHADCATVASRFIDKLGSLDHLLYFGSAALMYLAPALMGIFWGAPLVAREFEAGTHRIAWNQSVTRTRWALGKLGLVGLAAMATAGLLSLLVTWWASTIDRAASIAGGPVPVASGGAAGLHSTFLVLARLEPVIFAARGIAPLGYAAFAFVLGVTAGVLLRRTVPAMAVTLIVFVVIQVVVPNLVRPHLVPPVHVTSPVNVQTTHLHLNANASSGQVAIRLASAFAKPGAWVLSDTVITRSGAEAPDVSVSSGGVELLVPPAACIPTLGSGISRVAKCQSELAALHLRQSVSYQPASRFWPLQWLETAVYLVLAAALGGVCVWQVRRRRVP